MWANYSQNGRGFAIEYSHNNLEKLTKLSLEKYRKKYLNDYKKLDINDSKHKFLNQVRNVKYANEKYDETELISKLLDEFEIDEKNSHGEFDDVSVIKFIYYTYHTKKKIWEYEKEWRMVLNTYGETKKEKKKKHLNIQVIEDPIMPKAIYLGEFAKTSTRKVICEYCYNNGIKLYEMFSDKFDKKFELKCKEISRNNMHDIK